MAALLSQKEYFRQQAQRRRELADLISRPDLRARMLALADEHERIAADIEVHGWPPAETPLRAGLYQLSL